MSNSIKLLKQHTPIQNPASLYKFLGVSVEDIERLKERGIEKYYYAKPPIIKTNGKIREIFAPNRFLKNLLRRINGRIFNNIVFPHYLYGSVPDIENPRDYIKCAAVHCRARVLIKIDIEDYFPSITDHDVRGIFLNFFKFSPEVSEILTELTTLYGVLPQGAPTSTFLANLYFHDCEPQLVSYLESHGFRYTRLIDDITISKRSNADSWQFADARVKKMIEKKGLSINVAKSSVKSSVSAQAFKVHGVCIEGDTPRFTKDECQKIVDEVYNIVRVGYNKNNNRMTRLYHKYYYSIKGKTTKLKRVSYSRYSEIKKLLSRHCEPLPDHMEIKRINRIVSNLSRDYLTKGNTESYKSRFYRAHFRLSILKRLYKTEALEFKGRLDVIRPVHDD